MSRQITSRLRRRGAAGMALTALAAGIGAAGTPKADAAPVAAATRTGLPQWCFAQINAPAEIKFLYGSDSGKTSLYHYAYLRIPAAGERHAEFNPSFDPADRVHSLAVYLDGHMLDVSYETPSVDGTPGDESMRPRSVPVPGRAVAGIVDLASGAGQANGGGATPLMYAVTARGGFYALPMTYAKSGRLAAVASTPLTAPTLPALKGVESAGYTYSASTKKVTADILFAQTTDGRLLRVRVDRTGKTPRVAKVEVVATGWAKVAGFKIGNCPSKWNGSTQFLTTVGVDKKVNAYAGFDWNTVSLRGMRIVPLPAWKGATKAVY